MRSGPKIFVRGPGNKKAAQVVLADVQTSADVILHVIDTVLFLEETDVWICHDYSCMGEAEYRHHMQYSEPRN